MLAELLAAGTTPDTATRTVSVLLNSRRVFVVQEVDDLLQTSPLAARLESEIMRHPGRTTRQLADALGERRTTVDASLGRLRDRGGAEARGVRPQGWWPVTT